MNIKRYRAATMRAALEQVKAELGADALVLESKQVMSGGFFGIGSRPLVELKVAANRGEASQAVKAALNESGQAGPSGSGSGKGFRALAARAYANESKAAGKSKQLPSQRPVSELHRQPQSQQQPTRSGPRFIKADKRSVKPKSGRPATEVDRLSAEFLQKLDSNGKAVASLHSAIGQFNRAQDEMRTQMRSMSFSMNAMVARQLAVADDPELQEILASDPSLNESPAREIASILMGAGLRSDIARSVIQIGLENTALRSRSPETIARAGLSTALPDFVKFAADPLAHAAGAGGPAAIALIGPTGVGKTTTVAKLAARVVCQLRRKAVLVTLDTYRIAATEQLRIYAEIIGAEFHVANRVADLDEIIRNFGKDATVLVDTAGRSPSEIADEAELGNFLSSRADILKMLVLTATTHPADARIAIRQFGLFNPDQLILTKLDETSRPGASAALAADAGIPLSYICSGQRVPEDLERATPLTFAARLVRSSFAGQPE